MGSSCYARPPSPGYLGHYLGQDPMRRFGDLLSKVFPGSKIRPNGYVSLGQGFLVAHAPGRAILQVGHAGDEATVLVAPKYLYLVLGYRLSHFATSFYHGP